MTALWISLGAVLVLLLVWRLRRAAGVLDRILREERERTERAQPVRDEGRAEHPKR
ncbi:hypothetical protein [Actinophytocola sp.]|uniref:hypothetical protein n=1 Tax=Actinophytocola sp. TaxID=1872138 RepID=UPI002D7EAE60|nr:hypothetical protein [Actinophytocola sp.]HET9142094.1 hypothetical protein [Actinophytocola sp.]